MFWFIRKLREALFGPVCDHHWVTEATITRGAKPGGSFISQKYILRCDKCGDFKSFRV